MAELCGIRYLLDNLAFVFILKEEDGEAKVQVGEAVPQVVPLGHAAVGILWAVAAVVDP